MGPRLLILDEPTEGIQPSIIKDIERVIRALARRGEMAILLVEQYYDFARSLADQYLVMERGEIIARGAGADMERDDVRRSARSMIGPCALPTPRRATGWRAEPRPRLRASRRAHRARARGATTGPLVDAEGLYIPRATRPAMRSSFILRRHRGRRRAGDRVRARVPARC